MVVVQLITPLCHFLQMKCNLWRKNQNFSIQKSRDSLEILGVDLCTFPITHVHVFLEGELRGPKLCAGQFSTRISNLHLFIWRELWRICTWILMVWDVYVAVLYAPLVIGRWPQKKTGVPQHVTPTLHADPQLPCVTCSFFKTATSGVQLAERQVWWKIVVGTFCGRLVWQGMGSHGESMKLITEVLVVVAPIRSTNISPWIPQIHRPSEHLAPPRALLRPWGPGDLLLFRPGAMQTLLDFHGPQILRYVARQKLFWDFLRIFAAFGYFAGFAVCCDSLWLTKPRDEPRNPWASLARASVPAWVPCRDVAVGSRGIGAGLIWAAGLRPSMANHPLKWWFSESTRKVLVKCEAKPENTWDLTRTFRINRINHEDLGLTGLTGLTSKKWWTNQHQACWSPSLKPNQLWYTGLILGL